MLSNKRAVLIVLAIIYFFLALTYGNKSFNGQDTMIVVALGFASGYFLSKGFPGDRRKRK